MQIEVSNFYFCKNITQSIGHYKEVEVVTFL